MKATWLLELGFVVLWWPPRNTSSVQFLFSFGQVSAVASLLGFFLVGSGVSH